MISTSLNASNYSFFDKLKSVDYFLILIVMLIGTISVFSIYSTENGEFSFHEWPELGSQFDLISLEIYAYFGIICDVGFMDPTLLKFKNKERKTFEEHMSEDASWLIRDKKKLLKEINSQHLLYRDYLFYLLDLNIRYG